MKKNRKRHFQKVAIAAFLGCAGLSISLAGGVESCAISNLQTRHVVDMADRTVALPNKVQHIATVGSVPVLNGYLFALGVGEQIVNDLPSRFTASGRWQLHNAIAPYLKGRPVLQGQSTSEVSIEKLMQLAPDLVITMDLLRVRSLEKANVPVLYLEWGSASDIRTNMELLGCALNRKEQSEKYLRYVDHTMVRVQQTLVNIPPTARPKVLYFNPNTMSTPLLIANWWIAEAGGLSVTADIAHGANTHYSHERVLMWNPDILIVNSAEQVQAVYQDERFTKINAVRTKQVYATPMGAHSWGQRTVEQPLTVLWAAKTFHPQLFTQLNLEDEIRYFYHRFFDYELSSEEVHNILEG